jgi:hypothetical protein
MATIAGWAPPSLDPFAEPDFVGRYDDPRLSAVNCEGAILEEYLQETRQRRAPVVLMRGPGGVGKSRLARHVASKVPTWGMGAVHLRLGACLATQDPAQAFIRTLSRQLLAIDPTPPNIWARLAEAFRGRRLRPKIGPVGELVTVLGAHAVVMGHIVGLAGLAGGIALGELAGLLDRRAGDPPQQADLPRFLDAIADLNADLAKRKTQTGILIVIDQWEAITGVGQAQADMLRRVLTELIERLRSARARRIMLLLVVRDEEVNRTIPRLPQHVTNLTVTALPMDRIASLVTFPALGGETHGPYFTTQAAEKLVSASRGNLTFVLSVASSASKRHRAQPEATGPIGLEHYDALVVESEADFVREEYERFVAQTNAQRERRLFIRLLAEHAVDPDRLMPGDISARSGGELDAPECARFLEELCQDTELTTRRGEEYAFRHDHFLPILRSIVDRLGGRTAAEVLERQRLRNQLGVARDTLHGDPYMAVDLARRVHEAEGLAYEDLAEDAEKLLLEWLTHDEPAVLMAAAEGCRLCRLAGALTRLEALVLGDDELVACAALRAVAEIGEAEAPRVIGEALGHPSPWVRAEALGAVRSLSVTQGADDALRLLDDPDWRVKQAAALALGVVGPKAALPRLEAISAATQLPGVPPDLLPDVQRAAAEAMQLIRNRCH